MTQIIIVLAILLILLILLNVYQRNSFEGFEGNSKSLIICKAEWCGHCKTADPEFKKLIAASPISLKDGSKVTVKILDADADKSEISQYKVRGYPTILIADGGNTTEYPGERTRDGVINFLNSNY